MEESKQADQVADGKDDAKEVVIHSTTSLGILLIVFMAIFLIALFVTMTGKKAPEGHGREAFGPEDFPEVFGVEPVAGIASFLAAPHPITASHAEGGKLFDVPRPPFSEGAFPCSECHGAMETNPEIRRVKGPHKKIKLQHGDPKERWCLDCHDPENRDVLRLANGKTIGFEESYRLCGQCHGNVYRDWKIGIHGKRVGYWNAAKLYLLCVHCHDPHSPKFKPIPPIPPPVRPDFQREISHEWDRKKAAGTQGK